MSRTSTALVVLCAASFLAVVDTTIVSIALPSIRGALGFSPGAAQWVLNAYALVFGGLLLLFGRLADRVGRRRMFTGGLVVFAVGSALAGRAPDRWTLVAARVVQGAGAAAFVPSSLSLLTATFRGQRERGRAPGPLLNTATQLGGGIGLGIAATVVAAATPPTEVTGQALRLGFLTCVVFSLLALVLVRSGLRPAAPPPVTRPLARPRESRSFRAPRPLVLDRVGGCPGR